VTHPLVERRRRERAELIERVRAWASGVAERVAIEAVVVVGSVARGDFNKWSDTDVLVVARALPAGARARLELLHAGAPPGVQPVAWTPDELAQRRQRRDPIAVEADAVGVVVYGRLPPA
jgi:predicted nucleotidyltransferase